MPKRFFRKKRKVVRNKRKVRKGVARSMPMVRTVGLHGMFPPCLKTHVISTVSFGLPLGETKVRMFDVNVNNLYRPWYQTLAYDTAPFNTLLDSPASTALGFSGLAQMIGIDKIYQGWRVTGFTYIVEIVPESVIDPMAICLVPWKTYETKTDDIPVVMNLARNTLGSKSIIAKAIGRNRIVYKTSISKLFGVHPLTPKIDITFDGNRTVIPSQLGYIRCLIQSNDGGVTINNVAIKATLKCNVELFNMVPLVNTALIA